MVPSAREAHLAALMIGYSDPLTRRLASLARPSPPDAWCAVGWRLQGQRSAQRKGSSGWPQSPSRPGPFPVQICISSGLKFVLCEASVSTTCALTTRLGRAGSPLIAQLARDLVLINGAY